MNLGGADVSFFFGFSFVDNQIQGWFVLFLSNSNKNSLLLSLLLSLLEGRKGGREEGR